MKNLDDIQRSYEIAKKKFQAFGVNTDQAIEDFSKISVSLHCWQGDDVKGFEKSAGSVSQNIVTGNYPGAARNATELRKDIEKAFEFSPLSHRVNCIPFMRKTMVISRVVKSTTAILKNGWSGPSQRAMVWISTPRFSLTK